MKARTKGAAGERELASLIKAVTGASVLRNLEAVRSGGSDFVVPCGTCLSAYSIECKRYKKVTPSHLKRWCAQTVRQAEAEGKKPLLFFREDFSEWRCVHFYGCVAQEPKPAVEHLRYIFEEHRILTLQHK